MKRKTAGIAALILTAQVLLTACGETADPDALSSDMPGLTSGPTVEFAETSQDTQTAVTTAPPAEYTGPDMTGTELATTYTDEYGNIYGVEPDDETEESSIIITGSPFGELPDVDLEQYYQNTDPANTLTEMRPQTTVTQSVTTNSSSAVTEPYSYSYTQTQPTQTVSVTTVQTAAETAVTTAETTVSASSDANEERVSRRNAKVPSEYTSADQVMHTNSYYSLTDNEKYCYDVIVDAMLNYESSIDFPLSKKITFDDLFNAYQCVYTDEVRLYYADTLMEYVSDSSTGFIKTMRLSYIYSKSQVEKMQAKIDTRADEILSKITPSMSQYDMVKLIHDEVIKGCTYTVEGSDDIISIYGALADGKAQCQGYTRAFSYLCEKVGIETDIVLGVANEEHMWNLVKIDGKWYHIDLTWDDPDKQQYPDSVRYDYFCLTTARMEELRTIEGNSHTLPAADSTDMEYYVKNHLVASNYDEAKEIIMNQAYELSKTKASTIQFQCSDEAVYEQLYEDLFNSSTKNALTILTEANKLAENKFNTDSIYHNSNASTYTIKLFLDYIE